MRRLRCCIFVGIPVVVVHAPLSQSGDVGFPHERLAIASQLRTQIVHGDEPEVLHRGGLNLFADFVDGNWWGRFGREQRA